MHDLKKKQNLKQYKMVKNRNMSHTLVPQNQVSPSRGKHVTII